MKATTRTMPDEVRFARPTKGPNGRNICRHPDCGKEVEPPRRSWCGEACIEDWQVRNNPAHARARVEQRDHGICAACGRDCLALEARIQKRLSGAYEAARDGRLRAVRWSRFLVRLHTRMADTFHVGSLWDMDHIVPVVEGGGACGLDNLRTLCSPCHKRETRALAARRARQRREAAQPSLLAALSRREG